MLKHDRASCLQCQSGARCPFRKKTVAPDAVNHPPHYTAHPSGVECIDVVEHMGFNVGNAIKYLWRADHKGAPLQDLRKAAWYIEREIARRERVVQVVTAPRRRRS